MGSGFRWDFGATKGSKSHILAATKKDSVLVISTLSGASKSIKDKAERSPINLPSNATYKEQQKDGYKQISFKFERDGVKYESRWHEKTPNSPNYMGKSWQVEKIVKGQGHGSNPRQKERYHLLKGKNGSKKWISHEKYQECIKAKNNGTLTQKQKEVLDSAHWRD